jgi:hypothetical protein
VLKELLVSDGSVGQVENVEKMEEAQEAQEAHWLGGSGPIFFASMTPGSSRSKSNAGSFSPPRTRDCVVIALTLPKRIWLRDLSG